MSVVFRDATYLEVGMPYLASFGDPGDGEAYDEQRGDSEGRLEEEDRLEDGRRAELVGDRADR
uniref:Uncharacterized protein n=1 Tax=Steinernema glaseri TaxID=37863 RepID=A0A1I7YV16_9BILA